MLLIVFKFSNKVVVVQLPVLELFFQYYEKSFHFIVYLIATETGLTYWNGYKIDIRLNTCVENYIRRWPFIGNRGDEAPMYRAGSGNVYAREKDHWDIVFNNLC
jgi:hypothetical protein